MKLAVLGTVGVPACYGGFETLAENLVNIAHNNPSSQDELTVYCSAGAYAEPRWKNYHGANLQYSRFNANGAQSVVYDCVTALHAVLTGHDRLLLLGISGAVVIPILRVFSRSRIVTNIDGIEWRRNKWRGLARWFLRLSEVIAVRYSHQIIADNQGIADYIKETYGVDAEVIAYGGDHAVSLSKDKIYVDSWLPPQYALALCRIEPENNVGMILKAFDDTVLPLVFVGNWNQSQYGRTLREQHKNNPRLYLLDPIYEQAPLYALRRSAHVYIHGHSAGGTNPSLVEMMHFEIPVLAFDCSFNRYTTENEATYFSNDGELKKHIGHFTTINNGPAMKAIADRIYKWDDIGRCYFALLRSAN